MKKHEPNVCPKCGSVDIFCDNREHGDDLVFYRCSCKSCHARFTEMYSIKYFATIFTDEETDKTHVFFAG